MNERVITVLFSSATLRTRVASHCASSSLSVAQVIPMVRIFNSRFQSPRGSNGFGGAARSRNNYGSRVGDANFRQIGDRATSPKLELRAQLRR